MPTGPTQIAESLWQGDADKALPSAGTSQPPGLESTLEYNTIKINNRQVVDRFRVTHMDGFQGVGVRNNSEVNQNAPGETPLENQYEARTMTIRGRVEAGNIAKLRDMEMALRSGFTSLKEKPLYLRTSNPNQSDIYINARIIDKIDISEKQDNVKSWREFIVSLRASDPRFYSVNTKTIDATFGFLDDYGMGKVAVARSRVRNPLVTSTNGYSANGGSIAAPGSGILRYTSAAIAGGGPYYSGQSLVSQIPVTAGTTYTGSLKLNAMAVNRPYTLIIEWRDASNNVISTSSTAIAIPQVGMRYSVTGVAPPGATQVLFDFYCQATQAAGEVLDTSEWLFNEGTNTVFFAPGDGHSKWIGTANASESDYYPRAGLTVQHRNLVTNPTPIATTGFNGFNATITAPGANGTLRATITTAGTSGAFYSGNPSTPVEAGKTYTFSVKLLAGVGGRTFIQQIAWRNGAGTTLLTSSGSAVSIANGARVSLTATAPAGATQALPVFYTTNGQIGDIMDSTEWTLVEGSSPVPAGFVNGDSYRAHWMGLPNASMSEYFTSDGIGVELTGFKTLPTGSWWDSDQIIMKSSGPWNAFRSSSPEQHSGDITITTKFKTPAAMTAGEEFGNILKSVDANAANAIYGRIAITGATTAVCSVARTQSSSPVGLATGSSFTISANTTYWLRTVMEAADKINVTLYSGADPDDPSTGIPTVVGTTGTYTLTGLALTQFKNGISGYYGLRQATSANYKVLAFRVYQEVVAANSPVLTLDNAGNSNAEPKIRFYGPMTNPVVTNNTYLPDEDFLRSVYVIGVVPAGRYYEYDSKKGTLYDDLGASKLAQLGVNTKAFRLRDGANTIGFSAVDMVFNGPSLLDSRISFIYQDTWI